MAGLAGCHLAMYSPADCIISSGHEEKPRRRPADFARDLNATVTTYMLVAEISLHNCCTVSLGCTEAVSITALSCVSRPSLVAMVMQLV